MPSTRLVTAEELEKFPRGENRYELVEGRLIPMSPVGYQHGRVVVRVLLLVANHLGDASSGIVVTEVGFILASDPDTVRAPDVAFIRSDRLPSADTRGFIGGSPDAVIEVLSPDDRPSEVREKVEEYLAYGVSLVVVADPARRSITCHRRLTPPIEAQSDEDVVDLGDVIADFRCTVRDVFG
jgi:Uma2 family endonuclease